MNALLLKEILALHAIPLRGTAVHKTLLEHVCAENMVLSTLKKDGSLFRGHSEKEDLKILHLLKGFPVV